MIKSSKLINLTEKSEKKIEAIRAWKRETSDWLHKSIQPEENVSGKQEKNVRNEREKY